MRRIGERGYYRWPLGKMLPFHLPGWIEGTYKNIKIPDRIACPRFGSCYLRSMRREIYLKGFFYRLAACLSFACGSGAISKHLLFLIAI
jgi:hypothetical protein